MSNHVQLMALLRVLMQGESHPDHGRAREMAQRLLDREDRDRHEALRDGVVGWCHDMREAGMWDGE